jgi:alkanesulfonate monooxygenase SsuD/methylene tetrahydromethanopterin reductase-like flavin-dependent oxidoreductase (luciferase family)
VRTRIGRARSAIDRAGRAQGSLTTSFMTWCFVGRTEDEWRERVERARRKDPEAAAFDAYLAELEVDCIVGTPDRAAARLREYADAGVQRVMLNHELFDDTDMLEILAAEIVPRLDT